MLRPVIEVTVLAMMDVLATAFRPRWYRSDLKGQELSGWPAAIKNFGACINAELRIRQQAKRPLEIPDKHLLDGINCHAGRGVSPTAVQRSIMPSARRRYRWHDLVPDGREQPRRRRDQCGDCNDYSLQKSNHRNCPSRNAALPVHTVKQRKQTLEDIHRRWGTSWNMQIDGHDL